MQIQHPIRLHTLPIRLGWAVLTASILVILGWALVTPARPDAPIIVGAPAGAATTQTNTDGAVTVAVTWSGIAAGPVFSVVMDTHSVDLDGVDLSRQAVLRTDQGIEIAPSAWQSPLSGHHRRGMLTFPATTPDGRPVFSPATRRVELVIRDIAGVPERVLLWTP